MTLDGDPMRFLHTSDWHLGVTLRGAPCYEEQQRFLAWLVDTLAREQIDALIVAGDVFHRDQPSARALSIYYQFLARCAAETDLSKVIVVGGNHDSPSRLDAPAELLGALDVHVVGGLLADESSWDRCLCPIHDRDTGQVDAVVVAVPYVQEAKLGILTTSAAPAEIRQSYAQAFTRLYDTLARQAQERFPGAPLIATGHLTVASGELDEDDYRTDIHQVGTISGLPASIFGDHYDYIALGHIHRMYPISDSRAWYSGTPITTSRKETSTRFVLLADTAVRAPDGSLTVEKRTLPRWRDVLSLEGDKDAISRQLRALPRDHDLVPYLFVDVTIDTLEDSFEVRSHFDKIIKDHFEAGARPRIVDSREKLAAAPAQRADGAEDVPSLRELTPEDVFRRIWADLHGCEPADEHLVAFKYLHQTHDADDPSAADAPLFAPRDADTETDADTSEDAS